MRSLFVAVLMFVALAGPAGSAEVTPGVRKPTTIAPQELGPALQLLARERDFQIVYRSELIGHVRTEGARGDLTAEEAVEQLLRGTGLTFRHLGDAAITIVPAGDSSRSSATRTAQQPARETHEIAYSAASSDTAALSQVTIAARREALKQRLNNFVSSVTRANAGSQTDPLAVWDSPLCFAIAGLPREQGEYVLDRLSKAAEAAGAALASDQKCGPRFVVVFTGQPEALLRSWYHHSQAAFNCPFPWPVNDFIQMQRPVRVWYNLELRAPLAGLPSTIDPAEFVHVLPATCGRGKVPGGTGSHITFPVVPDFMSVLVVVDLHRVEGFKLSQIADYIAMSGLTKINYDASVADAPTILNLFAASGDAVPQGLTDWDRSFLEAIYHTYQYVRGQRVAVVDRMLSAIPP
jgi:Secretin and TonB N terminus short domain